MNSDFVSATKANQITIPDHILDMVSARTQAYMHESYERAFNASHDLSREEFDTLSTHNVVDTPERRELHKQILQEIVANGLKAEAPEKPLLIYISGPMAAGKSTLQEFFQKRMEREKGQEEVTSYSAPGLEQAYQHYKHAANYQIVSDFEFYKSKLPEFSDNNNNFGIIRAEASALDQAVIALAKELKSSIILEQLGDGPLSVWASEQQKTHKFISIGVTASPEINAQRLHERNSNTGHYISADELISTISRYSQPQSHLELAQTADEAILLQSGHNEFTPISEWKDGQQVVHNHDALNAFTSYAVQAPEELKKRTTITPAQKIDNSPTSP